MRAYKQTARKCDDWSIVNAAMRVEFYPDTSRVKNYFVAYGGMAPNTIMPKQVMSRTRGRLVLMMSCL